MKVQHKFSLPRLQHLLGEQEILLIFKTESGVEFQAMDWGAKGFEVLNLDTMDNHGKIEVEYQNGDLMMDSEIVAIYQVVDNLEKYAP